MQIGTQFSAAVHILLGAVFFKDVRKVTSGLLAGSAHINPAIIRKIMGRLREAGLIKVASGTGGISLVKKAQHITLKDIYLAIQPVKNGKLFNIHKNPERECPVGSKIINLLEPRFGKAQKAMETSLSKTTVRDLMEELKASQNNFREGRSRQV